MEIKLNFETKQVTPIGDCNLKEIVKVLKKLDSEWQEWRVVGEVVSWSYMPYVEPIPFINPYLEPGVQPYTQPYVGPCHVEYLTSSSMIVG